MYLFCKKIILIYILFNILFFFSSRFWLMQWVLYYKIAHLRAVIDFIAEICTKIHCPSYLCNDFLVVTGVCPLLVDPELFSSRLIIKTLIYIRLIKLLIFIFILCKVFYRIFNFVNDQMYKKEKMTQIILLTIWLGVSHKPYLFNKKKCEIFV